MITLDIRPVEPVRFKIIHAEWKEVELSLRPISIADASWLSEQDKDDPYSYIWTFLHQLSADDKQTFFRYLGVEDETKLPELLPAETGVLMVNAINELYERSADNAGSKKKLTRREMRQLTITCLLSCLFSAGITLLAVLG